MRKFKHALLIFPKCACGIIAHRVISSLSLHPSRPPVWACPISCPATFSTSSAPSSSPPLPRTRPRGRQLALSAALFSRFLSLKLYFFYSLLIIFLLLSVTLSFLNLCILSSSFDAFSWLKRNQVHSFGSYS